jgi:hypothetical protein
MYHNANDLHSIVDRQRWLQTVSELLEQECYGHQMMD